MSSPKGAEGCQPRSQVCRDGDDLSAIALARRWKSQATTEGLGKKSRQSHSKERERPGDYRRSSLNGKDGYRGKYRVIKIFRVGASISL